MSCTNDAAHDVNNDFLSTDEQNEKFYLSMRETKTINLLRGKHELAVLSTRIDKERRDLSAVCDQLRATNLLLPKLRDYLSSIRTETERLARKQNIAE